MSHFAVLVLSNTLNDTLAPYCEQDEEYYTPQDRTEEYVKDYQKHREEGQTIDEFFENWSGHQVVRTSKDEEWAKTHKRGYVLVDENDNIVKVISFWNDNAKWDYWTSARDSWSRWDYSNFIFKDPNFDPHKDTITIADLDLEAMINKIFDARRKQWKKVHIIFGDTTPLINKWEDLAKPVRETEEKLKENWDSLNDEQRSFIRTHCDEMWKKVRNDYNSQVAVKEFQASKLGGFWDRLDDYLVPMEEYVDQATLPFHSIVTDDGWFEPNEMGWWGMTHNETMTPSEWRKKQIELFKSLPEDTEVNLVDCHI